MGASDLLALRDTRQASLANVEVRMSQPGRNHDRAARESILSVNLSNALPGTDWASVASLGKGNGLQVYRTVFLLDKHQGIF